MGGDACVLPAAMSEGMKSALSTGCEPSPRRSRLSSPRSDEDGGKWFESKEKVYRARTEVPDRRKARVRRLNRAA